MKDTFNVNVLIDALGLYENIGRIYVNKLSELDDLDDVLLWCNEELLQKSNDVSYKKSALIAVTNYVKEHYIIDLSKNEIPPTEDYITKVSDFIDIISLKSADEGVIWFSSLIYDCLLESQYIKKSVLTFLNYEYSKL